MFKNLKKKMKDQRGLALIELLAVIVILGIIAAIAVPAIGGLIDKTKKEAKVAEAIQIINAAKLSHASNAEVVSWTPTGSNEVKDENGNVTTPRVGSIGDMVENVKDSDYTVSYKAPTSGGKKQYYISNHDASEAMGKTKNVEVSEKDLLDFSK